MAREPGTAIVSLSFDDGYRIQYNTFYQVLRDLGIKATFYVITSQIGTKGSLTWSQLNELFNAGHEIGSHTHTHPHLTELSTKELDEELRGSLELLKPFGCKTLAYPYGEYNSEVLRSAQEYYLAARGYHDLGKESRDFGLNMRLAGQLHKLRVIPTETVAATYSKPLIKLPRLRFQEVIEEMASSASQSGAWMILVLHGQNGIAFRLRWIRELSSKFRWMCEYLTDDSRLRILTISKAAELLSDQKRSQS